MAGNQGNNRIEWQQWQLQFIKDNWQQLTAEQISKSIGITRTKVREKKYELGLYSLHLEYWTPGQVSFLKKHYKSKGDTELAEIFNKKWAKQKGWTKKHIEKKRRYLKLKRTKEDKRYILDQAIKKGIYSEANKRRWENKVAKVGEIRIWEHGGQPVKVIKTKKGFVHFAPWLYKQQHGRVPVGYIVRIKDGDPLNVTVDNLELISRKKNALLNSRARNDLEHKRQKAKNQLKFQILKIKKYEK